MLPTSLVNRLSEAIVGDRDLEYKEILRLVRAGISASDHGNLKPFRFILIEDEARGRLGNAMSRAYHRENPKSSEAFLERLKYKTFRAPTLIAVIFSPKKSERIPLYEQKMTAGCSAQMIVAEAYLMGLGAMWRTGHTVYSDEVANELSLIPGEEVVGVLYIGNVVSQGRERKYLDVASFISRLEPIK